MQTVGALHWWALSIQHHVLPPVTGMALTVATAEGFRMTAFDTTIAATLVGVAGTGMAAWISKRFESRRSTENSVLLTMLEKKEAEVEELRKRLGS